MGAELKITDEVATNVLCDMVEDAAELYIGAYVNYMRIIDGKRNLKHPESVKRNCLDTLTEVTLFFCSDYGESLTGLSGEVVMRALEQRAKEAYNDGQKVKKYKHTRYASVKPYQY